MATSVADTLQRIKEHKGVKHVMIVTSEGTPIRAQKGMDDELTQKYAQNISILTKQARHAIRELDSADDLTFLRIRSKQHEIMVAPDKDFLLIVVQDPTISNKSNK